MLTAARDSAQRDDLALVAMLGLLGRRIFEATGANIGDLGEEHGHRVLKARGKGDKTVLVPLPPAVNRALEQAIDGRAAGPILRTRVAHASALAPFFTAVSVTVEGGVPVTPTPGFQLVYKGLAIAQASDGHTYLYAANFRSGRVEAYDDTFTPVELPGGLFVDPRIPAGYAQFNVQELAGQLYVTYASRTPSCTTMSPGQVMGSWTCSPTTARSSGVW
jgi:hypothetical protein